MQVLWDARGWAEAVVGLPAEGPLPCRTVIVPRENVKGKAFIIWWSFSGEENDHIRTGLVERARSIAYKLIYFIPKSRFSRCLHFIS